MVLVPGSGSDARCATKALADVARAHSLLDHPQIPPITGSGSHDGAPFIELGCDAVVDGVDVHRALIESQQKIPLGSADGFISGLLVALQTAHGVTDPETRGPLCVGQLSYANVLFSSSGRSYLVGFGRNFPNETECGRPDGWLTTFQAPEVSIGGQRSPQGDYVALSLLARSLLPLADPGPHLGRVLRGDVREGDADLIDCLRWSELHMISAPAALRGSIDEARQRHARIRDICGIKADPEGFAEDIRALLAGPPRPACQHGEQASAGPRVVLGLETSWIAAGCDGARRLLGHAHRRIITALADLHRREPGAVLTIAELLAAGWPDERPIAEAGANRVYVALAQLRRMGMRDIIERHGGGYRFAPNVDVQFSS